MVFSLPAGSSQPATMTRWNPVAVWALTGVSSDGPPRDIHTKQIAITVRIAFVYRSKHISVDCRGADRRCRGLWLVSPSKSRSRFMIRWKDLGTQSHAAVLGGLIASLAEWLFLRIRAAPSWLSMN
jgi:hypothetical protein